MGQQRRRQDEGVKGSVSASSELIDSDNSIPLTINKYTDIEQLRTIS